MPKMNGNKYLNLLLIFGFKEVIYLLVNLGTINVAIPEVHKEK
jgi:hypothetical protein